MSCAAHPTRILMHRRQPIRSGATSHVTRTILAALLVFATLASAVHPDAVFAMVCCEGMGGAAVKDSCPFMRLKGLLQKEHAQSESKCHAGMDMSSSDEAMHADDATPELFPATNVDGTEHAHDQTASSQDTTTPAKVSYVAAFSKPCSSDGCCQTNSLTRTPRPRDAAAITNKFRPRPPTSEVSQRTALAVIKDSSAVRRLSPARAPPASL
jgi:hypothetical protein